MPRCMRHRKPADLAGNSTVIWKPPVPPALSSRRKTWNGQRKTDRRDARQLASALWDCHQRDNKHALRPMRIPLTRRAATPRPLPTAQPMHETRHRLEAHGRSLLWDHDWLNVPEGWWKPRVWPRLEADLKAARTGSSPCSPHIVRFCASSGAHDSPRKAHHARASCTQCCGEKGADQRCRNNQLRSHPSDNHPRKHDRGTGAIHSCQRPGRHHPVQINTEVMDWQRFKNRGQAGSFIGCCPSERSSGKKQKLSPHSQTPSCAPPKRPPRITLRDPVRDPVRDSSNQGYHWGSGPMITVFVAWRGLQAWPRASRRGSKHRNRNRRSSS